MPGPNRLNRPTQQNQEIRHLDWIAKLMDAQFTIPGTKFKFGLDGIVGLIPGAGDISTFAISAYLIAILARNGASGYVVARMVLNVVIDAVLGMIPILGDIFDIAFKANLRNMKLMKEHYVEGRHKGGAWKIVVPILLLLSLFIGATIWASYKFFAWLF